jgi:hypothetical protein
MPVSYDSKKVIKPLTQHHWTTDMVQEYTKCALSPRYFMLNHVKVVDADPKKGVTTFQFRDYQMRMLKLFETNDKVVLNCPRQSGKSTVVGNYCLWYAMFSTEPVSIFILANKGKTAQSLLDDIKFSYEEMEPFLKRGIEKYNETSIEFDNGSKIQTGTTSKGALRGESVSLLILDEFAHVPKHIADEFYTSVFPTISKDGCKVFIISTPKGNSGRFYELFSEAKRGENGFAHFEMAWDEVPGRDEAFRQRMIKATSLQEWKQEFEASFLGSAKTLINPGKLPQLGRIVEEPIFEDEHIRVWENPKPKKLYLLSCDIAKGVEKDYSVIQGFDVTNPEITKQVMVYANNLINPFDFAEVIYNYAKAYNNAYLIIENNIYGSDITRRIHQEFEYDYMYRQKKCQEWGVNSNSKTKPHATSLLKKYLEESRLMVRDKKTYDEICNFIEIRPDIYQCEGGKNNHDDRVVALMWAAYFIGSEFWKDIAEYARNEVNGINEKTEKEEKSLFPEQFQPFIIQDDNDNDNKIFDDDELM